MNTLPAEFCTIRDFQPEANSTALVRVDFNVPISNGTILDDFRIQGSVPTIESLLDKHGSNVVLCSHMGRPKNGYDQDLSLEPVAEHLSALLNTDVRFVPDAIGKSVRRATQNLTNGSVVLLENLRFYEGETSNDSQFASSLASDSSADYFVQDGFSVTHRTQASTDAVTRFLPSMAGLLVESEYCQLTSAIEAPERPLSVILGGAKVSDKLPLINNFIDKADRIIVGGAMAHAFLKYKGYKLGSSLLEPGMDDTIETIYNHASKKVGKKAVDSFIILPEDVVVETGRGTILECHVSDVPSDAKALDIGRLSVARIVSLLGNQGTVIMNGPVGLVERQEFANGSKQIARHIYEQPGLIGIGGGGDTANFIRKLSDGCAAGFSLISRGGGATLSLLSGQQLPGLSVLPKVEH